MHSAVIQAVRLLARSGRCAAPAAGHYIAPIARLSAAATAPLFAPKAKKGGVSPPPPPADGTSESDSGDLKEQAKKAVDYVKRELAKLRGGTPNPQLLDHVVVDAYGERQPLSGLAQVTMRNPQLIMVSPFDTALSNSISNAIRDAGLNLNPSVEGSAVKVPIPKASRETRDASLKLASRVAEAGKATIRRHRQEAMDKLKKIEGVSSDDIFRQTKEVQAVATEATDEISKLAEAKKAELEAA